MRLIDADALSEKLCETTIFIKDGEVFQRMINDAPTISAEAVQGWIPVSERLPEEHEWIGTKQFGTTISDLINITFEVDGQRFVKVMSLQNGKLCLSDRQTMDVFYKGWKMIAWMPLPEPYKGGDEE